MNSLESFLSEVPVFQKVDQNTLTEIANRSSEKSFQAQEIICYQGDNWPFLFLVKSGHINAIKESPEGRSFITTSLYESDDTPLFKVSTSICGLGFSERLLN